MPDGETFSGRSIKQSAPGRSGDEKAATFTSTTTISLGGDHQNHQLLHDGFGARIGRGLREAGGASLGLHGGGVTGYRDQDAVVFCIETGPRPKSTLCTDSQSFPGLMTFWEAEASQNDGECLAIGRYQV